WDLDKKRAQPGLAVLLIGTKTKTTRGLARRSTEQRYYTAMTMRIKLKNLGQEKDNQNPQP
ncbi:MAG: hypothetical protein WA736_13240, partial [Candidatus Acidiferrum sp.]